MMSLVFLCAGFVSPVAAQNDIEADMSAPVVVEDSAGEEEDTGRQMIDYPVVKLRSLDKITARTVTFEAKVGSTLKFGPIFIKVQSCRKASPLDEAESAAFLQVWEVDTEQRAQWIFSGWMFASSPGLSAMDHPIYDVWVLDCQSEMTEAVVQDTSSDSESTPEQGEGVIEDEAVPAKPEDSL